MLAAKGKGRRKMGRYLRGAVDEELSLGTLAAKDVTLVAFDETVNERTLATSIIWRASMSNWTPTALSGPVMIGVSHGDYLAAEIEEWIENTGSWNEGDKISQEIARRKIRRFGIFDDPESATLDTVLNNGRDTKTKLNWILNQGETLNLWAYNMGSVAIGTTVPVVSLQGHVNLFPT